MKHVLRLALCALVATAGCVGPALAPTHEDDLPTCQTSNTASVNFGNRSAAATQDVVLDGVRVATLAPGEDGEAMDVPVGVSHLLEVRVAGTGVAACAATNLMPEQCSNHLYTCAFP